MSQVAVIPRISAAVSRDSPEAVRRRAIPLIRAAVLEPAISFLAHCGASVERLLLSSHLHPDAIRNPDALVPFALCAGFLEDAATATAIPDLGLRVARNAAVTQLGTFGHIVGRAVTLRDTFVTLYAKASSHSSAEEAWIEEDGDRVTLSHRFLADGWGPQAVGMAVMLHLNLIRAAVPTWRPAELALNLPPTDAYRKFPLLADTRIVFEQPYNRITFPAPFLALPCRHAACPRAAQPDDVWMQAQPAADLSGSLRQFVTTLLAAGYPDIEAVAHSIGLSRRTLQRRLREEGYTYSELVMKARVTLASMRLRGSGDKLVDIALDLGYADSAHFSRAFRRWTGVPPGEFRAGAPPTVEHSPAWPPATGHGSRTRLNPLAVTRTEKRTTILTVR